ncbi:MAG: DNA processing protein [Hyphomicrobiaceae bacterium]|jgi:DNA processing protein
MDETRLAWIRLAAVASDRTAMWMRAAQAAGGPACLLEASREELAALGVAGRAERRLRTAPSVLEAKAVLGRCRSLGLELAVPGQATFPDRLLSIPDPPVCLYWFGRPPSECHPAVAIVGTREPSPYGKRVTRELARHLAAAGVVVTSGLARGIDQTAHEGALETGLTAAVLPGGLDAVYPARNSGLCRRIAREGWVLGEHPPGVRPRRQDFPRRNRVVTGLAEVVVVVEATHASGTWTSAMHALAQGTAVFAVPGDIDRPQAALPNQLLHDGCPPLLKPDDVLELLSKVPNAETRALGHVANDISTSKSIEKMDADQAALLACLGPDPRTVDQLSLLCSLDGAKVMTLLTSLELAGLVSASHTGGYVTSGAAAKVFIAATTDPSSRITNG